MYFIKSLFFFTVLCVVSAFLNKLPSGSLLQNAKIKGHRQHICIFKVGNERCFYSNKPGKKEDIKKFFDIYKETDASASAEQEVTSEEE